MVLTEGGTAYVKKEWPSRISGTTRKASRPLFLKIVIGGLALWLALILAGAALKTVG